VNRPSVIRNLVCLLAVPLWLALILFGTEASAAPLEEGIAIGIVYDTSGSMLEPVKDSSGKMTPKYQIANRAVSAIINRLETFVAASPKDRPRQIQAGLFVFSGDKAGTAVKFGAFDASSMRSWLKAFSRPEGSTPLGEAVRAAGQSVLASNLSRKHVLVVTDGINTRGPDPSAILPSLRKDAAGKDTIMFVHFVAFDIDAKVFAPVRKLGATVVGAVDEVQLNSQLELILEEKILLEAEAPPSTQGKKD